MKHSEFVRVFCLLALGLLGFSVSLPAQKGGQTPPPAGGGAGGAGGSRDTGPSTPSPSPLPGSQDRERAPQFGQQAGSFPEIRRPLFVSGKVMLEDGTPPPESAVINRVCNGVVRPEGYTDSRGRFSFELGRNAQMFSDASVGSAADPAYGSAAPGTQHGSMSSPTNPAGGFSERDLMGCELQAALPGYRSEAVILSGRRILDNPDVGTIILRRLANVEGSTVSFTSLQAPKDAKKALEKGREAMKKQKWDEALKHLEKAVGLYPQYASAWQSLGQLHEEQNRLDDARKAYGQALAADAKFVSPYMGLANLALKDRKWGEVAETTDKIIKMNPIDFPGAYYFNAVANYNLKKFDVAEKSASEGLKADSQHKFPKMDHLLAVILAQRNDYTAAARHMKSYLQLAPNAGDAEQVKSQLAELERLMGQSAQKPQ